MWRRWGKKKARQLWEQEFTLVKNGLAEDEVVQFVNDLLARQYAQQEGYKRPDSFPVLLSRRILADAERDATNLRLSARAEAERLIAEAQQQVQKMISDARHEARATAEQEANGILEAAAQKAHLAETQALQVAHLFLIRAREEIQERLASDTKEVYHRLLSSLQDLLSTAQAAETEWSNRKIEPLWGRPLELKDYQAVMMDSLKAEESNREALPGVESGLGLQAQPKFLEGSLPSFAEWVSTTLTPATSESETDPPREAPPATVQEAPPRTERASTPEPPRGEAPRATVREAPPRTERASAPEPLTDALQEIIGEEEDHPPATATSQEEGSSEVTRAPGGNLLYSGEVDLVVIPPVSAAQITTLYSHLQSIPDLKVLRTAGSWDRGTVVTVVMVSPRPLIKLLSDIPALDVKRGAPGDSPVTGLREKGRTSQWIGITFKTQDSPHQSE